MMILRPHDFARHFRVRRTEWMLAFAASALGLCYLTQPMMFSADVFSVMRMFGSNLQWGTAILTLGIIRLVMLWINGSWRVTPFVRATGAFLCSGVWFVLFATQSFLEQPPQARWIWLVFLVFDLLNAGDAAFDAGIASKRSPEFESAGC